jgi:hypothetical protein
MGKWAQRLGALQQNTDTTDETPTGPPISSVSSVNRQEPRPHADNAYAIPVAWDALCAEVLWRGFSSEMADVPFWHAPWPTLLGEVDRAHAARDWPAYRAAIRACHSSLNATEQTESTSDVPQ